MSDIQHEDIALLLDWQPEKSRVKNALRKGKLYEMVHETDKGFLLLMERIHKEVGDFPNLSINSVFDSIGLGDYKPTLWSYVRKNPRFELELNTIRSSQMDALVALSFSSLKSILDRAQSLVADKQGMVVLGAIKIVLESERAKALGFSSSNNKDLSVLLVDRRAKPKIYDEKDLEDV